MLRQGLERRSAQLGVSASFSELVDFKRELERLEVFVEISNLALKQVQTEEDNNPQILLENWIWGSLSQFMDDSLRVDVMPL